MKSIAITVFVSLVFISEIYGHTIHKRLLENPNEASIIGKNLLNGTNREVATTTTLSPVQILKEPQTIAVTSNKNLSLVSTTPEAPEILVHPYVEATEVHQSNESDVTVLSEATTNEKSQNANKTNSSTETVMVNVASKPLQIIKEDCTCFSIRRPNSIKNSQKFENSTTSVLSEVESEIGILFEIASGVLPKVNEFIGINTNETEKNKITQNVQATNNSEIIEVKNDEPPFFEDFIPFFPLESLIGRGMPQETIIIQTESDGVDHLNLLPKLSQNGTDPLKKERDGPMELLSNSATKKSINKVDEKKHILA